jgi:hypothetical protein
VSVAGNLSAAMAVDLCMGRGHCGEEEQQRHRQPAPREAHPSGVTQWSARLNVIHPYSPTSFAPDVFAVKFSTANPLISHGPRFSRRSRRVWQEIASVSGEQDLAAGAPHPQRLVPLRVGRQTTAPSPKGEVALRGAYPTPYKFLPAFRQTTSGYLGLATGVTDIRKGFDSLAAQAKEPTTTKTTT